jgi:hypothetical protein
MDRKAIRLVLASSVTAILGLASAEAPAQAPDELGSAPPVCNRSGRLHRLFHHSAHTFQDKFIGYPDRFVEPPLGYYLNEQLAIEVAKADPHRFTVYRSDFLPGTNLFSPAGASRFNIMYTRIPGWLGPITVEWTPEQPDLAQSRRQAILATMERAGRPLLADRVVIAPSPFPGALGTEAANNFVNTVGRGQTAGVAFPLPPTVTANAGVH